MPSKTCLSIGCSLLSHCSEAYTLEISYFLRFRADRQIRSAYLCRVSPAK